MFKQKTAATVCVLLNIMQTPSAILIPFDKIIKTNLSMSLAFIKTFQIWLLVCKIF